MKLSLETHVQRDVTHVAAMTGERELAVMSVVQGAYYGLNEVATRIWELTEHAVSVGGICAILQGEYEIEPERCEREVVECLERMIAEGLVCVVDA